MDKIKSENDKGANFCLKPKKKSFEVMLRNLLRVCFLYGRDVNLPYMKKIESKAKKNISLKLLTNKINK